MEYQIALREVENKGLDHLEHAGRGEFQIIEAVKGRSREKVGGAGERKQRQERGRYRRVLRVWLALIMETRKGTAESPRGLCEISSSIMRVNEAKQREDDEEREEREKKEKKKQT